MDPRILGLLLMLYQMYNNQVPAAPQGPNYGNIGLGGLIAALLARPVLFVLNPLRFVGRGVGWLFGFAPAEAAANNNPAFVILNCSDRAERDVAYQVMNAIRAHGDNSGMYAIFVSERFYNGARIVCTIIVTAGLIYIVYNISRRLYVFIRSRLRTQSMEVEVEMESDRLIKDKLTKLEREREKLNKISRSK
jgi:hypothetical protein